MAESNNGTIFMLLGGAALLLWFMNQNSEEVSSLSASPSPGSQPLPGKGPSPAPPASSYQPHVQSGDVPPGKKPQEGNHASDPVVPIQGRLIMRAGTGSQSVDEWNEWMKQEQNGAEQPDPDSFMPQGYNRTENISATDYVRYRGLGRSGSGSTRYNPQATRVIRQSNF